MINNPLQLVFEIALITAYSIPFTLLARHSIKQPSRPAFLLTLAFLAYTLRSVFFLLEDMWYLENTFLFGIARLFYVQFQYVYFFAIIMFWDVINREDYRLGKMMALSAAWSYIFAEGVIQILTSEAESPFFSTFTTIVNSCVSVNILYYMAKIYLRSPPRFKFIGRDLFWTFLANNIFWIAVLIVPIDPVAYVLIYLITGTLVFVTFAWILIKFPQFPYILPFRVLYLTVFDTKSGLPFFTHSWQAGKQMVNEMLFSGMLQGVSSIIKESVNRGNVQEIILDEGIMILQRSKISSIACALVSTNASRALRIALRRFTEKFDNQFSGKLAAINDVSAFEPAAILVDDCFYFIPAYD